MFEIDYSLIPLSDPDGAAVDRDVIHELRKGAAPKLTKADSGRLVVLNPDPVHTVHHIPDALRAHLRRITLDTTEGRFDIRPEKLLKEMVAGDEPLHLLIIELKARFPQFAAFLEVIPKLRQRYPEMGVFLSGDQGVVLERLQEVMQERGVALQLTYGDARGTIEIEDPGELNQVVAEQEAPVSLAVPFFTQLRLNLDPHGKPSAYNLDTLRRLHGRFGYGPIREVDMGAGRKEKVVVLDLPVRLIRDFQFRQERGLDFHGILLDGRKVLSRYFDKEKLEFRWIPFQSVEAFLQKTPGHEEQQAFVARTNVLRVNCFNGETTFVTRSAGDQISLDDVKYLGFRLGASAPGGTPPVGKGNHGSQTLFDGLILPGPTEDSLAPVQHAVRSHIYGRVIRKTVERARKLEIFTRNLKVGAVGPLAAQTLKIFRRFGLEGLIAPESFHYLCDLPPQLVAYFHTPERFQETFLTLLDSLRAIAAETEGSTIRVGDFAHNLPVTLEWIDAPGFGFEKATAMEMEVVYNEMQSLVAFIGQEFRRNFDLGQQDLAFFEKIGACQRAGLLAKWMADFKNGAYGPPLGRGEHPDFVFFGTPADKKENDERFFFPSLACSEFFQRPETQHLFAATDYDFSVFLEHQVALADHFFREQGQGDQPDFAPYFEKKTAAARAELESLREARETIDATNSPGYLAMLREEEAAYHQRFQAFVRALDQEVAGHQECAEAFLAQTGALPPQVPAPGQPPPEWFSGDGPDPHVFGAEVMERLRAVAAQQGVLIADKTAEVLGTFQQRLATLKSGLQNLDGAESAQKAWQTAQRAYALAAQGRSLHSKVPGRINDFRQLDSRELEGHRRRIRVQLSEIQADGERMEQRLAQQEQKTRQTRRSMREVMERLTLSLEDLGTDLGRETPLAWFDRLEKFVARLERVLAPMHTLAERLQKAAEQLEQMLARKTRLAGQLYALRLDGALLEAAGEKSQPDLPTPAGEAEEALLKTRAEEQRATFLAQKKLSGALGPAIQATPGELGALLRTVRPVVAEAHRIQQVRLQLEKTFARKVRRRASIVALGQRRQLIEAELAELPRQVREKFMPARKELLLRLFIPEAEKKIGYFQRAHALFQEIQRFQPEMLRSLYLERAVFRRFSSNQFLRGGYVAGGARAERGKGLHNVLPAVNLFHRNLLFNYAKQHGKKAEVVSLRHLKNMENEELWEFVQGQLSGGGVAQFDYLVLPGTLELSEAVALMNRKARLNHGVPNLVLIYVSKFDPATLLADERLRAAFFKAQRHNVILNIDGHSLVDNPHTIGLRLLQETLGSTFDTPMVEDMEEEEQNVAFRV